MKNLRPNEQHVSELLLRATSALGSAINRLGGDKELEIQRQWLEVIQSSLQAGGFYSLQSLLLGRDREAERETARAEAAGAIGTAAKALDEAAGLLIDARAEAKLKKAAAAVAALGQRVDASASAEGSPALIEEEQRRLRKFAAMLMGQTLSAAKVEGLKKAREARKQKMEARMMRRRLQPKGKAISNGMKRAKRLKAPAELERQRVELEQMRVEDRFRDIGWR